jgi:hypothetical protein
MKIRVALLAAALLASGAATGCRSFVPMTQEIRDQNHLSDADLKNLQYYVSGTITLQREAESGGGKVTGNHKLIVVAGKTIEQVVIEERTPGICVGVGPHTLSISFEQGTSIDFAPAAARSDVPAAASSGFATAPPYIDPFPGNPGRNDVFSGGYMVSVGPRSTVTFLGRLFDAMGDTQSVTLLIDAESLDHVATRSKVLPGLKLPSR